jgi:hypothetical protein
MRQLSWHDLQWSLRRCPEAVLQLLKEKPGKVFVAGGFVRSCVATEHINDVDLFVPSKDEAWAAAHYLALKIKQARTVETKNAISVYGAKLPIQIIHRWTYTDPAQLMDSFDFTIAMAGFWWEAKESIATNTETGEQKVIAQGKWVSICHDRFYEDLAAKRLIYTSPKRNEDAGGSLLRVLKFYQRNYRIPLDCLGAVMARLVMGVDQQQIGRRTGAELEDQYAKVLTGLLRLVDPNVDPSHIYHLPSESAAKESEREDPTEEGEAQA